jgi:hypothetical protein
MNSSLHSRTTDRHFPFHPNRTTKVIRDVPHDKIVIANREVKAGDFLKEYTISMNSKDRNKTVYPNTFEFVVDFGIANVEDSMVINRDFENVEYIMIDNAIFPLNVTENFLYVVLDIDEVSDKTMYSTSENVKSAVVNMYFSTMFNTNTGVYVVDPSYRIIPFSRKKLTRLTIKFMDPEGNTLIDGADTDVHLQITLGVRERSPFRNTVYKSSV